MTLQKILFIAIIAFSMQLPIFSQDDEFADEGWIFKSSGYYKNLFMYQERDDFLSSISSEPEKKKMVSDLNRLRLSPEMNYGEIFTFHSDIDIESITTNYYHTMEFDPLWRESEYNDFADFSYGLSDNSKIYSKTEFQNIYVKMVAGRFTGTAGRQQIRFGSSRLWNPLDLMNPLSPVAVEGAGEQKGTDALRLDWYLGESTEMTGVAAPKKENDRYRSIDEKSGNYIVRFKSGTKDFDYAFLYGYTAKRTDAGGDVALELFDGLLTGVFLFSDPQKGKEYYQCGTGYEYTFTSGLYFLMEYFYNSLPVNNDENLQAALFHYYMKGVDDSNYYTLSNRIITYNSHYMSIAAGYDFHPLVRGELFSIYDFQGRGIFINASIKVNAMENLDITAGVITAFTGETERVSDFAVYDREPVCYASMQFYF